MSDESHMPLEIDASALTTDALRGIAESFVLREGTDYGAIEIDFERKVENLLDLIRCGDARVIFDPQTQSVDIIATNP